jgi:hypothetical protein
MCLKESERQKDGQTHQRVLHSLTETEKEELEIFICTWNWNQSNNCSHYDTSLPSQLLLSLLNTSLSHNFYVILEGCPSQA